MKLRYLLAVVLGVSVPAMATPSQDLMLFGKPGWVKPGATIDLNFATGQRYAPGAGPLVDARASPATCFDAGGNLVQVAANVPCVAGGAINSWEARMNVVPNNTMTGAGVGVWPTGWPSVGTVNGLTTTVVGKGVSQGMTYLRLHVTGTASATATQQYNVMANASAPACVQNQAWSNTWYFRNVSGTPPAWAIGIQDFTAGIGFISGYQAVFTPTANWAPYTFNVLIPDATAALCNPIVYFTYTNTTVYNFIFDVAVPQFELDANATLATQAFATPPILTTSTAVTRQADNISLATQPCANPSILASGTPSAPATFPVNQNLAQVDAGSDLQRTLLSLQASTGGLLASGVGGTGYSLTPSGTWAQSALGKLAVASAPAAQSAVFNNGTPATATAATLPTTPTTLRIGVNASGTEQFNGTISRVALACGASLLPY